MLRGRPSRRIANAIRAMLQEEEIEVEAKSLASDRIPGLIVLDENQRRLRDYMVLTQGKSMPGFLGKKTFVVNTNNKLIQAIARLSPKQPDLAASLAKSLYDLSLLGQKEIDPSELELLISHQTALLEKLASLL